MSRVQPLTTFESSFLLCCQSNSSTSFEVDIFTCFKSLMFSERLLVSVIAGLTSKTHQQSKWFSAVLPVRRQLDSSNKMPSHSITAAKMFGFKPPSARCSLSPPSRPLLGSGKHRRLHVTFLDFLQWVRRSGEWTVSWSSRTTVSGCPWNHRLAAAAAAGVASWTSFGPRRRESISLENVCRLLTQFCLVVTVFTEWRSILLM